MSKIRDQILRSWALSADLHEFELGADPDVLDEFERSAGWVLPDDWKWFYGHSNGAYLFDGCLQFYPLLGDHLSVLKSSDRLRQFSWPIPTQLWVAGDNGEGDLFGLWVPSTDATGRAIVALGQIFRAGTGCMAVTGSHLERFLLLRTSCLLLLCDGPAAALDALAIPPEIRADELNDETRTAIEQWADPSRPGHSNNPYEERLNATAVDKLLRQVL